MLAEQLHSITRTGFYGRFDDYFICATVIKERIQCLGVYISSLIITVVVMSLNFPQYSFWTESHR